MTDTTAVLAAFLRDHPEHRPDVATQGVEGEMLETLTTEGMVAFIGWAVRTGRCADRNKAYRFRGWLLDNARRMRGDFDPPVK